MGDLHSVLAEEQALSAAKPERVTLQYSIYSKEQTRA
jgi:hypothetical protein